MRPDLWAGLPRSDAQCSLLCGFGFPGCMSTLADPSTIKRWRERPGMYVRERFGIEPDPWQDQVLMDFPNCPRQAMQACKGPGKTSLESWIGWNFLETRPHPKIAAVSNSKDNLRDNLWA